MKTRWFLLPLDSGGTDFRVRHHVTDLKATSTACGKLVSRGLYTQHYPKKQPPKCRACVRAVANNRATP